MGKNNLAPIMGISRLRMGTDGKGITSLVAFHGCPLNCKYCLNPQCHSDLSKVIHVRPNDVYNIIAKDELYFLSTGGGVTFGGGEPLMYSKFILDVLNLGAKSWNVTIETSLNVPYKQIDLLLPYIDEMVVDIKDINPQIYESYTKSSNIVVIDNLKRLVDKDFAGHVLIRIPLIKGYNTNIDVLESKHFLENLGYLNFNLFEYKTIFRNEWKK